MSLPGSAGAPIDHWHEALSVMLNDLQYLLGRPEEADFVFDQMKAIHYRREWVEEREHFEQQRQSSS
jgi:hypothetical protein